MAFPARRCEHEKFAGNCHNLALLIEKHNKEIDAPAHGAKDVALLEMAKFKLPADTLKAYKLSYEKWKGAILSRENCEIFEIESKTRVLLGTGNASVFEFGFNLNYPWGVPYIAGSSLKGLVSSYLKKYGGEEWWVDEKKIIKSNQQVELFGGEIKNTINKKSYIGTLTFHDAWLSPWTRRGKDKGDWFDADIINAHNPDYYSGKRLPDGTENPIPIKIAALCQGLKFMVTLQGPEEYRKFAKDILLKALYEDGIGGKTAVGYGRFQYVKSTDEENTELITEINTCASASELILIFRNNKKIKSLRNHFKSAIERIGYSIELDDIWKKCRPLFMLYEKVNAGQIKELKELNRQFNDLDKDIASWQDNEKITLLKSCDDGQKLFNLIISKWAADIPKNEDLNVFKKLAYNWDDLLPSVDRLLEIIDDKKHVWPPKSQLCNHINNRNDITENDKIDLLEMLI